MDTNSNKPVSAAKPEINVARLRAFLGWVLDLYSLTSLTQVDEDVADLVRAEMDSKWALLSQAERDIATALSAALDKASKPN